MASQKFQYLDGIFDGVPALRKLVINHIEVRPASLRTARGGTCCGAIADEVAFWRSDYSANPDTEILNAIRPSLATTGGLLACISSPYAQRGELYGAFRRDYGPEGDAPILIARASSRAMNPTLSQKVVDRAYERDPVSASAEYDANFRTDVETFIPREVIEAAVILGRYEIPYIHGTRYCAFVDPSGGSADSMTLAIAHAEGNFARLNRVECPAPRGQYGRRLRRQ
jgi:hypothetical protein